MEDGEHSAYYHHGIRGEFVILSLVVTVVAMNVYIGLLSELYSEAEKQRHQLFNHFAAEIRYRHLCHLAILEILGNTKKTEDCLVNWGTFRIPYHNSSTKRSIICFAVCESCGTVWGLGP